MIQTLIALFAGLSGLCFGSFLNVCLSRWPEQESVVQPRSHCRNCAHTLSWWENIPLLSWILLRGRCRQCRSWIGWRYPLVEACVGALWTVSTLIWTESLGQGAFTGDQISYPSLLQCILGLVFIWLLVALAFLDMENLWLPDFLTLPGTLLGVCGLLSLRFWQAKIVLSYYSAEPLLARIMMRFALHRILAILAAAAFILLIRRIYWLVRRREGLGLGDAKLMALLAAWMGLPQTILAFVLAVLLGSLTALFMLMRSGNRESWAASRLPLGTFLCIGGIVSSLWGQPLIHAYLQWAGL
jgi:leader peptidase (prepilin peptidase)/N-methyltransferase